MRFRSSVFISFLIFTPLFLILPALALAAPANTITITDKSGTVSTNYPMQFGRPFIQGEIANFPQVRINGSPVATQADVKNRFPDGSVKFAIISVMIPTIPANGTVTLSFQNQSSGNNTPLTTSQMLDASYNFDAKMNLAFTSGTNGSASARTMLQNGDYKLWTSGQIAQTVEIADDTTARKYDLGNGDGYHPFRPRFYATFWPATHQVTVRYVGENGLTTELEDLKYNLNLTLGSTNPQGVFSFDLTGTQATYPKKHWALSNWTKVFWQGGAPQQRININHNLPYLAATHVIPNYDTSITVPESAISFMYTNWWVNKPNQLYDGVWNNWASVWMSAMGAAGGRSEIAPYPGWSTLWMYTGDWRMREMALGMADLASAFPGNLRENDPTKNMGRTDAPGAGTGLGRTVSISSRPTFISSQLTHNGTLIADKVKIIAPLDESLAARPFTMEAGHEPQPFFPQYVLTGDPYYLNEMYMWAGYTAAAYNGTGPESPWGRGPTGTEGAIGATSVRLAGWAMRGRAEVAFIAPDGAPEKNYFTYLTNDALARWEGGFGVTGTPFTNTFINAWGNIMGDHASCNSGPVACQRPPLHNWESNGDPNNISADIAALSVDGTFLPGALGSQTSPWMQWIELYSLGRAKELGFAAGPMLSYTAQYLIGMINDPTSNPQLIAAYRMPVERAGGGYLSSWPEVLAAYDPSYVSTTFNKQKSSNSADNYLNYAGAAISYETGEPGGAQAWSWYQQNLYTGFKAKYANDPRWAIVPRTDSYQLPAISTSIPASPLLTGTRAYLSPPSTKVVLGQSMVLSWGSFNATSCTGSTYPTAIGGFSTGGAIAGSVTVTPSQNMGYTVTCIGPSGSKSAAANAYIKSTTQVAATLTATPTIISNGQSSTLTWTSANATSCTGTGFTASASAGSVTVTPSVTTTYSITCTGTSGSVTRSATVTVGSTTPVPTATLTASPVSIIAGQSSTLKWSSTNATSCTGTGFSTGSLASNSTGVTIAPSVTTTYSITCTGTGGTSSPSSATVTVSTVTSTTLIQNITTTGDFSQTNNCPNVTTTGQSCTVSLTFTPTTSGTRSGTLSFKDMADGTTHTVALSGSGVAQTTTPPPGDTTPPPTDSTLSQGLAGYWSLDASTISGTSVTDVSGNGKNGILKNFTANSIVSGKIAEAIQIGTASYQQVTLPNIPTGSTFTFSAWVNVSKIGLSGVDSLASEPTGLNNYLVIKGGVANKLNYRFSGADHLSSAGVPLNVWTLVTLVVDNGAVTYYMNGAPDSASYTGAPGMTLGALGAAAGSWPLIGLLDDVRIYNRALSADEISQLYTTGQSGQAAAVGQSGIIASLSDLLASLRASLFALLNPSGQLAAVTLSQTSLDFGSVTVGQASASQSVTITTGSTGSPQAPSTISIGSRVKTTVNLNVRAKPNTKSGKIICTQAAGALGTVIAGPQTNQGYIWWSVNYDTSCDGWSAVDGGYLVTTN